MPSLNVDLDYFDHPKTRRLIGLLGRGAEVLPLRLLAYCGKYHAETGRLADSSPQEIEAIVGWWGRAGACAEVLAGDESRSFGAWDGGDFVIHNWHRWQGHLAAYKARGKKAAAARWGKVNDVIRPAERAPPAPARAVSRARAAPRDASSMLEACNKHATSNAIAEQSRAEQVAAQPTTPSASQRAAPAAARMKPKKRRKSEAQRTPDEWANLRAFERAWCETIWPRFFGGVVYDFNAFGDFGLNRRSCWGILDHVGHDVDKALLAAKCFAQTFRDSGWRFPCPLAQLRREMLKWVNHAKLFGERGDDDGTNANARTASRPGEFASDLNPRIIRASAAG